MLTYTELLQAIEAAGATSMKTLLIKSKENLPSLSQEMITPKLLLLIVDTPYLNDNIGIRILYELIDLIETLEKENKNENSVSVLIGK